jgi:hypothetical protein
MASLPSSAYAGDSIDFEVTVAAGSTGKAYFRHVDSGKVIEIAPSISGSTWTVSVSPLDTVEAEAGIYTVAIVSELSGERSTVEVGAITLLEPISRPTRETHARKMVAMLEAHIEGRIADTEGRGLESYTIGGVPISKIPLNTARELLVSYREEVQREVAKRRAAAGLGTGNRVQSYFTS